MKHRCDLYKHQDIRSLILGKCCPKTNAQLIVAVIYESYTIEDKENMQNQNFLMRYNKRFSKKKYLKGTFGVKNKCRKPIDDMAHC